MIQKDLNARIGNRGALADGEGLRFEYFGSENSQAAQRAVVGLSNPGFVIEFDNTVYAYKNSCPHLGVELDWAPGIFFDDAKEYLVCSTHGAHFEPHTGKCVSGPCIGQSLTPLSVVEEAGEIYVQDARCVCTKQQNATAL